MESLREFYELHKRKIILCSLALIILLTCLTFFKIEKKYNKEEKEIISSIVEKKVDEKEETEDLKEEDQIKVDVKGFVTNEGVYTLTSDARVIDAINAAGGLKEGAYTRYLNLSKMLFDEDVIIVNNYDEVEKIKNESSKETYCEPINQACLKEESAITSSFEEKTQNKESNPKDEKVNVDTKDDETNTVLNTLVNINTADKETLMTINGIGESKAQKIIEYRNINGYFESIEDIKNVSGIGDSIYEKIKAFITV